MDLSRVVAHLAELFSVNLNVTFHNEVTRKEQEVAKHLSSTISSLINSQQFRYEKASTLDHESSSDESEYDEEARTFYAESGSEADDEGEKENQVNSNTVIRYSNNFMREAIDYADATDTHGKRHRSWNTVHHRYRTIPIRDTQHDFDSIYRREEPNGRKSSLSMPKSSRDSSPHERSVSPFMILIFRDGR